MFRPILSILLLSSLLLGQNYRWPIRASQSLSATFSEYRSGHLHAGIDIKTWGEMEVPCLAIADGYIEHIAVGYNGYGRGLWLRLNDGSLAVYGHLEQFNPLIENLIRTEQLKNEKYSLHLRFTPDQHPVKAGSVIGYSGTSGTEHPHLHFEIRDTLGQIHNPQFFYPEIKDHKAPILDEIMLIPVGTDSRINGSLYPVVFDMQKEVKTVSATGPFRVALNTHDRANGTYNKYNIYRAEIRVNDSLVYEREFDRVARRLTDDVDKVYPGVKGKRGWRFMSMFNTDMSEAAPFAPESMSGIISPAGLSELQIKVSDIYGNKVNKNLIFHEQVSANWELKHIDEKVIITRHFSENGYENIQFYTGHNSYLPISETMYRMTSTSWVLGTQDLSSGVRALGAAGGKIKWIIPPQNQGDPELDYRWKRKQNGFVLQVNSIAPYVFPLTYSLTTNTHQFSGELIQTTPTGVESSIIPLDLAALAKSIEFLSGSLVVGSLPLDPMEPIARGQHQIFKLDIIGAELSVQNTSDSELYIKIDTSVAVFNHKPAIGINIKLLKTQENQFSGRLSFSKHRHDSTFAIFSPGKKKAWDRQISPDSSEQFEINIKEGGSFFLLRDNTPPVIKPLKSYASVRRGERLVFKIKDNTGVIAYPRTGIKATLDGALFFPDYNPLRHELSFHIPKRLGTGQHIIEFSLRDSSGNVAEFKHQLYVKS